MGLLPFEEAQPAVLVRREAATSEKYGKKPSERSVQELLDFGVVVVDKPPGPSSHQVSAYAAAILGAKTGHSGTLDPKVTGVLPVGVGRGTRVAHSLLTAGKEYVCLLHWHAPVDEYKTRKLFSEFLGRINQLPPIKSAVKRQVRERTIYYLELLEQRGQDVLFRVGCQAGTYIRKLCHDMGQSLKGEDGGAVGAHMAELRRTKAGPFGEEALVTLHDLADAKHYAGQGDDAALRRALRPAEDGLGHLKKVWVLDSTVESLCQGVQLKVPGIAKLHDGIAPGEAVAVMTLKDEAVLVGTAQLGSQALMGETGLAVRTTQVFLSPGTYPRQTKPQNI